MPCYKPLKGYRSEKGGITFNPKKAIFSGALGFMDLPCGRCIGCRLEKTKEWAIRCYHESQMHDANIFLTLTYSPANIPEHGSLVKTHFQKLIRALRQSQKQKIRFYMCGEYGDQTNRPHYHALLFGFEFPDQHLWLVRNKSRIYRSSILEKHWPHGYSEIGAVTFKSAGYVARYIMKKLNGERAINHYNVVDPDSGEVLGRRQPEYTAMSTHPGIGESWYRKFKDDVFPEDCCITPDGRQMQTPKYYRDLLQKEDPKLYEKLRQLRIEKAQNNPDNSEQRLAVREVCHQEKAQRLIRPYL